MFTFAWVNPDQTTFDDAFAREDEQVLNFNISQDEGDFATLEIEIVNPRVGLLGPGRKIWAWFGVADPEDSSGAVQPLFFGRLIGAPEDLDGETVKISFTARPLNFTTQKANLAAALSVLPYYDPIWFDPTQITDPDNALEARSALWHIDRVTHEVTISDIIAGEDGTITVDEGIAFYDSIRISYGDAPARRVNMTATVTWNQIASGKVGITQVYGFNPAYESYTGEGVVENWPKPAATIGGGWSVGDDSSAARADGWGPDIWTWDDFQILQYSFASHGKGVIVPPWAFRQVVGGTESFIAPAHMFVLKRWVISGNLSAQYDANRGRTEIVQFSLASDTQSILTDSTDGEAIDLVMNSSEISSPVDLVPGNSSDSDSDNDEPVLTIPLRKPWARSYFTTDRGDASIQYLLMLARAKLLATARCVEVAMDLPWAFAMEQGITLRKSLILSDLRMPGGIAGGKIKSYELTGDGDTGVLNCSVKIGCTIGHGGTITATEGTPTYVDDGYVTKPYQRFDGEFVMPVAGEVAYSPIGGFEILDDGFDFDHMTQSSCMKQRLAVTNQADAQEDWIRSAAQPDDVYKLLNDNAPTTFTFEMKPVTGGPFLNQFFVDTTLLVVPKTIDLEATSESDSSS